MALAGELAKYVGNELVKTGSKELAKAGARSALSSLVPSVATQIGTDLATKAGSNMATQGVLNSLVPIRSNWAGAGDIEGMLNGKFLGTNQNYFDNTFARGALDRATYGPEQAVDRNKVAGLVRAIKNNEDIAPIAGFKNDDGLIDIFDGHHRLAAYQKAGKMPRVKLFDRATKDDAYAFADDWAKNAAKQVEQYLPAKPKAGLDEYGMGTIDLRHLNEPKVSQSIDDSMIPIYHGTPNKFEDFDDSLPSVWFSDSNKNLKDTGLTMKGGSDINVMERMLPRDLKIADEDLADRLTKQQLQDRGYAGIAYTERGPNGDETYYEIFKPNDTLKKLEVQQSLELSPEQLEFFKDSKLRDANGQLIPVYHSTPADFTVFDNAKLGENTGYDNTAMGHFVTTDKDFSSRFKDIDGKGVEGRTMKLYANVKNPITHPYMAGQKYDEAELDKIVEDYLIATDNQEFLQTLKEYAEEDGSTIYDEYMDMTFGGDSPFEFSGDERDLLQNKGYDAVEIVEGPKSGLVEGSNDNTPVSSYAIFDGANLKDIRNLKPTSNPDVNMSYYDGYGSSGGFAKDVKAIGTKDVAPIDPDTLPEGYDFYRKVSEKNKAKYGWVYDEVSKATGKPARRITNADLRQFLEDNYPDYVEDGKMTKYELEQRIQDAMEDELTDEAWENGADLSALVHNKYPRAGIRDIYNDHSGRTGKLDRELSRRLGIGESNSVMMDRLNNDTGRAAGDVAENRVGIKFDNWSSDEDKVGVMGHERLHLFQNASKRNDFNYEKVKPVYQDLHEDLKKALLNEDEIRKAHAGSEFERMGGMSYWGSDIEQEARMLEAYLYSEGYVKARPYRVDEFASKMDIIKPAFDKFFKKLRALSKKGIALPAVAGLVGIGALAGKKDDKKLDNVE